jgi:hypothetical protein
LPVLRFTNAHPLVQVPVIAVFTKMDALDNKAFNHLVGEGVSLKTAKEKLVSHAKEIFDRDYYEPLQRVTHKPRSTVQLRRTFVFLIHIGDSPNHPAPRHGQTRQRLQGPYQRNRRSPRA